MKLFLFLAIWPAFIVLADYVAYHREVMPLFLGIAMIAIGVVGILVFNVLRTGERRNGGRK